MPARRVLIVEDDEAIRDLVGVIAERAGVAATCVSSGLDAIAALEREQFSAVLLDLMMPEVNGYDVIEHIRKSGLPLPVVVMTAAVKSLRREILDPSVVKIVLTKPFEVANVVSAIQAVVPRDEPDGEPDLSSALPDTP